MRLDGGSAKQPDRFARVSAEGRPVGEPPAPTYRIIQQRIDGGVREARP